MEWHCLFWEVLLTDSFCFVDRHVSPIVIEEIFAFEPPVSINNLQIAKQEGGLSKLIVITDMEVKAISLERCQKALSCR